MEYDIKELRARIYELLDENQEILEERSDYGDPGASASILIERFLPIAAREVLSSASPEKIDESRRIVPNGSPERIADYVSVLEMPSDFLRLLYFRMSDWEEGVTEAMEYGSLACRLRSRIAPFGYRMTRPGVSLRRRGNRHLLMIYGSGPASRPAELEYLAMPELKDGKIDLPPGVVHDVCCRVSTMIREIIRNNYRD